MKYEKKPTALVTGGYRGIGGGIVKALVTNLGFHMIIADVIPPETGFENIETNLNFVKTDIILYELDTTPEQSKAWRNW